MITFITALYPEAKELINKLNLKRQNAESLYQLFEGENICLIITGAGMIAAATAVSRHFALYPAVAASDIVVNLGVAGYAPWTTGTSSEGDLFLASKITEAATGRTFYPDFLYRHPFRLLPLVTVPAVCNSADAFSEETLVDMEASSLYQALLPHISPDRMFFFKAVSDIVGAPGNGPVQPEALLSPHLDTICSFAEELHRFLTESAFTEPVLSEQEQQLSDALCLRLPMTEAMSRDYHRLLKYAKLARKPLAYLLQTFLDSLEGTHIRGKKQAMPYLEQFREIIINETGNHTDTLPSMETEEGDSAGNNKNQIFYRPFFSTVYAERNVWNEEWENKLSKTPIFINHYKDIFNRSHQDFAAQKKAPSLILAKKTGTLIYKGAPVCQNFGNEHFYYTSCMMNCIYHCDYCYLQGMYPSGHVVVFVNLEDYFKELEALKSDAKRS